MPPRYELGQTQDPTALIPGNPAEVHHSVAGMAHYATALDATGEDLKKIDDGGWTGPAAGHFHEVFDREPARWLIASDVFTNASHALGDYADTLEWAQGQAAEAIALWEQGQELTLQAEAEHQAAVTQAQAVAAIFGIAAGMAALPQSEFHDPGQATRQAARDILDRARQQLDEAGNHAARILAQARDTAPFAPVSFSAPTPMFSASGIIGGIQDAINKGKDLIGGLLGGDNSKDGFTGTSLGPHQLAWIALMGPVASAKAVWLQQKALARRTNGIPTTRTNNLAQRTLTLTCTTMKRVLDLGKTFGFYRLCLR